MSVDFRLFSEIERKSRMWWHNRELCLIAASLGGFHLPFLILYFVVKTCSVRDKFLLIYTTNILRSYTVHTFCDDNRRRRRRYVKRDVYEWLIIDCLCTSWRFIQGSDRDEILIRHSMVLMQRQQKIKNDKCTISRDAKWLENWMRKERRIDLVFQQVIKYSDFFKGRAFNSVYPFS